MNSTKSKKPLFLAALVAIAFVMAAIFGLIRLKTRLSKAAAMPEQSLAVKTVSAFSGEIKRTIPALATVKSASTVEIKAEISGKLIDFPLREGDLVKKGDLIAVIEAKEQQAQLGGAQARFEMIEEQILAMNSSIKSLNSQQEALKSNLVFLSAELKRDEELFKAGAISASSVESSRNKKSDAKSKLSAIESQIQSQKSQIQSLIAQKRASGKEIELWQVRKNYSEVRSNIDGVISSRLQEPGNSIMPGTPLVTVEDTSLIRLIMQIPQEETKRVKVGQEVILEGFPKSGFEIKRIYPRLTSFGQIEVEAEAQRYVESLKLDMQIPVKVVVEVISGTVVPAAAMFINFAKPSETFLYFIEGKTAKRTSLKPLSISDENAGVFDSNAVKPGTILAAGSYLENVRLPASFSIEVIK